MAGPSPLEKQVAEVYRLLSPMIQRHLYLILRDSQEAEDLSQEAFLRFFKNLRQGERIQDPRAWLLKVARNLAFDRLREGTISAQSEFHAVEASVDAEQRMLEDERMRQVADAMGTLSPQERLCLELRAEGLKYREIASAIDATISTVQTALERAVRKLTRKIHD